jgi:tRNA pseudouridine55 synthase
MATGLLVIGVNRATRLLGHLALTDKAYSATIRLGISTVTDDAEGEVTSASRDWPESITQKLLEQYLQAFRGNIEQVPSAVSAIKINGVRSYARVRAGEQVDLRSRPVHVSRFECLSVRPAEVDGVPVIDLDVEVECSTGTYVRALARDLGAALGVGGHLTALRRTRVGNFDISEAQRLEGYERPLAVVPLKVVARRCFATLTITDEQAAHVRHGRRLPEVALPNDTTAVLTADGTFLALYGQEGSDAVAEAVLA